MEASQEDSQGMRAAEAGPLGNEGSKDDDEDEDGMKKKKLTPGAEDVDEDDDGTAQVQSSDKNRVQSQDEIQMEDPQNEDEDEGNAGVGVIQESVHGDEEDGDGEEDNEDDAPVLRHGRTTRVSGDSYSTIRVLVFQRAPFKYTNIYLSLPEGKHLLYLYLHPLLANVQRELKRAATLIQTLKNLPKKRTCLVLTPAMTMMTISLHLESEDV